ncbi:NADH-quinone oxidoreductase subunit C [Frateuria aurantia]
MSNTQPQTLAVQLAARFGDGVSVTTERRETVLEVAPADLLAVATALRDEAEFQFQELIDLAGVDYLGYGQGEWDTNSFAGNGFSRGVTGATVGRFSWAGRPHPSRRPRRFATSVQLLSLHYNRRLRLRVYAEDDQLPLIPSLTSIWPGVNWFEREAFDLFGIVFEGHPDLRRLLTDYGFVGHPFRKDFPLIGNVEVRYDANQQRVVYQPVSIEPRVLVPRALRNDSDLEQAQAESADHWREN